MGENRSCAGPGLRLLHVASDLDVIYGPRLVEPYTRPSNGQRLNRTEPSTKILHRLRGAGLGKARTGHSHWPDEGTLIGDNQGIPVIRFFLYRLATIADDLRNHWHISLVTIEGNPLYESATDVANPLRATPVLWTEKR